MNTRKQSYLAMAFAVTAAVMAVAAEGGKTNVFSNVRGIGFIPPWGSNGRDVWLERFDAAEYRRLIQLGKKAFPKLNTLRIVFSMDAWYDNRELSVQNMRKAGEIVKSEGMKSGAMWHVEESGSNEFFYGTYALGGSYKFTLYFGLLDGYTLPADPKTGVTVYVNGEKTPIVYTDKEGVMVELTVDSLKNPNPFEDVASYDLTYDAILWAYYASPQVTNGIDKTHFGPDRTVTRGQAVTFLWRAAGCPEPTATANPFVDVASDAYYYKPVLWAVEMGITNGTDATHFTPDQTCSTAHIITFLYRTMGLGANGWYEVAEAWAIGAGLLENVGLSVDPREQCPRSCVVLFLYRVLGK